METRSLIPNFAWPLSIELRQASRGSGLGSSDAEEKLKQLESDMEELLVILGRVELQNAELKQRLSQYESVDDGLL
jgi:DNA mismatch repair protein MutH